MQTRRRVIQNVAALAGLLAGAGWPQFAQASSQRAAFNTQSVQEAVKAAGGATLAESDAVTLTAPDVAENGAVVPLGVASTLPDVAHLLILVEKNPNALVALFQVTEAIEASFQVRAKMMESSDVYAVAITRAGQAFWAKKNVTVTLGGCGG